MRSSRSIQEEASTLTYKQALSLAASEELRPLMEKPWLPKRERHAAEMRARHILEVLTNPRMRNSKFIRERVEKILSKNN